MTELIEGAIYDSNGHGMVRYEGLDTYFGQTTFKFRVVKSSQSVYKLPEAIDGFLKKGESN